VLSSAGVVGIKTEANLGTLWRSAWQLGAAYIFTVGARFEKQGSDTYQTWTRVPCFEHRDWAGFCSASPYSAPWVAVEMGGVPLEEFEHPDRAVYLLGSEDTGLPESVVRACALHVSLPSIRSPSYNVAVAGSILMYDRLAKSRRKS
jgi:tRNA G18 (ribose-2'-O)-methylase SpoU